VQRCYGGIEVRGNKLRLDPQLPAELRELRLSIIYRSQPIELLFNHDRIVARLTEDARLGAAVEVDIWGTTRCLGPGDIFEVQVPDSSR
jgi:trehalose/maltose hydrolase-like predicted phosphorylase